MFDKLPRANVAFLPTPLHPLRNLADSLGFSELWIKRDDLTGPSFGGNKSRKLEIVMGDAIEQGADTVITVGAVQSNHCRQTAAFAAAKGLRCILLLAGEEPKENKGNLLLDKFFGAELQYLPGESTLTLGDRLDTVTETLQDQGFSPYPIPAGASNSLGCIAYADAFREVLEQGQPHEFRPERIILATGTGGTQAGLLAGEAHYPLKTEVLGVSVMESSEDASKRVATIVQEISEDYPDLMKRKPEVIITDKFVGEGYGVLDSATKTAIEMFAKLEAIILDPVYTGKAGLALIQLALSGDMDLDVPTLFWHTGGSPALFAHSNEFFT
ncbi:MAG: D-cysteine desulfhydrase family protein [Candidatus Thorarchaeota archaeon]